MNENNPLNPQISTSIEPAPKQSNFLIVLLSILLLISCLIAGFFAYQTQNLVKELTKLQITPTPIAITSPDPTINWVTYLDKENRFTFRHPSDVVVSTLNDVLSLKIDELTITVDPDGAHQWGEGMSKEQLDKLYMRTFQYPDKPELKMYPDTAVLFYIDFNSISEKLNNKKQTDLLDQILLTFKFIEPEASSSPIPVACTMEAKICPDGSSVGRTGPKCEFSPCPTPKP